ncbi:hypothetical protein ScPMuIL_014495 [Solemya velum]
MKFPMMAVNSEYKIVNMDDGELIILIMIRMLGLLVLDHSVFRGVNRKEELDYEMATEQKATKQRPGGNCSFVGKFPHNDELIFGNRNTHIGNWPDKSPKTVYEENAGVHIMSGKTVQRSLRGHLLVDKCLHDMLVSEMANSNSEFAGLLDKAKELYFPLLVGQITLEGAACSDTIAKRGDEMKKKRTELYHQSKTS